MAKMLCRTKGNAPARGKPRVYFTCHPQDFDKYFDKICQDIFKTYDCAIYYTEDMTAIIGEQDKATDLESNNLFVVPVTLPLLTQPNRAMDFDIPLALEKHIPVLPIIMETGLDSVYSRPDRFGELQYLTSCSTDATEISYEEKLKKHLEAVLISNEMAKRIRAAFHGKLFLSYRKKDRRYANELMRLIHSYPQCRDIAIWFDEFLTPGESFRTNIQNALQSSKLFILLVTPNLLEEPEGRPNFVMSVEYPAARDAGIGILPAEMEETDKAVLEDKFKGIPACVDPHDGAFKTRLVEALPQVAVCADRDDPTHNFLMGLAYLEGIDVEVDRQRGLELITSAGEANLPEAMERLYFMYDNGVGVPLDYQEAAHWALQLMEHYRREQGEEYSKTHIWMNNLAACCHRQGDHKSAIGQLEKAYALHCKVRGRLHPETLDILGNLAAAYGSAGDYKKALALHKKTYTLRRWVLGREHLHTLLALDNLASAHGYLGNYEKKLALHKKAYDLRCRLLGEEHPDTLTTLNNLAVAYGHWGNYEKEFALHKKVYALRSKVQGEKHPDTLISLGNLATVYGQLDNYEKELELHEKCHALYCEVLGQEHPDTLTALNNLAVAKSEQGVKGEALVLISGAYNGFCKVFGKEHPQTLAVLSNLARIIGKVFPVEQSLKYHEEVYSLRCKVLGETHPDTLSSMRDLAEVYGNLRNHAKALELLEQLYALQIKTLGPEHAKTKNTEENLRAIRKKQTEGQK